ncbi:MULTISPECIES: M1 family metallopeptidase [unclassified Paenibacillus]|uniref:M1 family metallopeptidase n=1 Tax=unclassified Paenibacillus TaxID=185978 RepID=UPI0011A23E46|nr:M1 family metallopeptidase [Paenibacillus sp. 32O-W]
MKLRLTKPFMIWLLVVVASCAVTAGLRLLTWNRDTMTTTLNHGPILNDAVPQQLKAPDPSAPPPMSRRIVEYHISAALQPDSKSLSGSQSLTWENPGKLPVEELYFHMYPNAFESKKTTFLQESAGKLRQDEQKPGSYGSMTLHKVTTAEGTNLLDRMEYVQPDDGNKNDRTLVKLSLPAPVLPGQKVTLSMDFEVQLPEVFARMGYADDFYMAGQWFPKIAVYEPEGMRGRTAEGWNLHQYHGNSEFYADFGIYDVIIKVPSTFTVAATGFPTQAPVIQNDIKTYHFYADDVHDFAWAASPNFQYYEEPFSTSNVPGVKIKLYLDPKHEALKGRYLQAAKKSLARFSEWYGAYPYSTLSIVVPPGNANGAGGMEYPTLITAWGAAEDNADLNLERVVVHEIGHQFFYGMVASNEFEEAWLDEGFTSYAEDLVMEQEYGIKPRQALEATYITAPASLTINAWDYDDHSHYADNVYIRGKLILMAIEQEVGSDTMKKIMKTYFQRWKFRHPTTKDFQSVVEDVTKRSWEDFFQQFVYGSQMIDYSVDKIRIRPAGPDLYDNEVLITRKGAQHHTVPIQFHFTDGTKVDKLWDSQGSQILYNLSHSSPLSWVVIDPEYTLILENRKMNNFMNASVDDKWKVRWNTGIVKIIETVFGWVSW